MEGMLLVLIIQLSNTAGNTNYGVNAEGLQRVINPETISETLDNFGIQASSNNPIYKSQVDEYLKMMNSGTFESSRLMGAAGYINNGQVAITSGHHRVVAAAIRGMQTGDYSILQALIRGGNFNFTGNSVEYGYKFFSKFPKQWQ